MSVVGGRDEGAMAEKGICKEEKGGLLPMAWGSHVDAEQEIIRVGRKKASIGLEIFCLESVSYTHLTLPTIYSV